MPLIECEPTDSDECITTSPKWNKEKDCAYAKSYCDSWAKDARRCCPQTCGTGVLTKSQCEALDSKGTCIYPAKNQCQKGGTEYKTIFYLITLIDFFSLILSLFLDSSSFYVLDYSPKDVCQSSTGGSIA